MKYMLKLVLKRLCRNKKTNILILFQMIVGILLLSVFLNVNDFINKQYEDYLQLEENYKFNIYTERQLNADSPPLIETQEKALKNLLNDKFSITIEYDIVAFNGISHFDDSGEEVLDKYIIQYTTEVNEVFAEEEFIKTISEADENNTVDFEKIPFKISESKIFFPDEIEKINILDPINEQIHIIKIPLKYYYQYNKNNNFAYFSLNIELQNMTAEKINDILYETETILEKLNSNYDYILSSEFFNFMYNSSFDFSQSLLILIISVLLILIVYIGMISFFILLVEKRKFEIAISLALGAKKSNILFEFAIEFFIISFIPMIISNLILRALFQNGFTFINIYVPTINNNINLAIFAFIVIINLVCLIPIFIMICKLKPQEILQKC